MVLPYSLREYHDFTAGCSSKSTYGCDTSWLVLNEHCQLIYLDHFVTSSCRPSKQLNLGNWRPFIVEIKGYPMPRFLLKELMLYKGDYQRDHGGSSSLKKGLFFMWGKGGVGVGSPLDSHDFNDEMIPNLEIIIFNFHVIYCRVHNLTLRIQACPKISGFPPSNPIILGWDLLGYPRKLRGLGSVDYNPNIPHLQVGEITHLPTIQNLTSVPGHPFIDHQS